jgi:ribonucleoside-diphosphate reductase alpha chain
MAPVPGEARQANYPSTVAYIAAVLLFRMEKLGVLGKADAKAKVEDEGPQLRGGKLLAGIGRQCPSCYAMTLHKVDGCDQCSACGHTGSCG